MSKGQMPGSMDLLLDTMCNTFGGVMFIAISLSLALFVNKTQTSPAGDVAKVQQVLKEEKAETLVLEEKKNSMTKKALSWKELASQYKESKSELPEVIAELEQQQRNLKREISLLSLDFSIIQAKRDSLQRKNKKTEAEIREKQKKLKEQEKRLKQEYERKCSLVNLLEEQLNSTPPSKTFFFAHNQPTSLSPYWVILQNDCVYRLKTISSPWNSTEEVKVEQDGNKLCLSPINGRKISDITEAELSSFFRADSGFFLSIFVNSDSFASFVEFRRMLRKNNFRVKWSVKSTYVLTLVDHVNYSASD